MERTLVPMLAQDHLRVRTSKLASNTHTSGTPCTAYHHLAPLFAPWAIPDTGLHRYAIYLLQQKAKIDFSAHPHQDDHT